MPKEEKYTPNNSFMGMASQQPKIAFFGRGKIGSAQPAEMPPEPVEDDEKNKEDNRPEPVSPAESTSPMDFTSLTDSGMPESVRLVKNADEAQRKTRLMESTSPTDSTIPPTSLWDAIPEQAGHNKIPNAVIDHLCRYLTPGEQAIFHQLFRLSYGYGKDFCKIGLPKLAERSNMSQTATQQALKGLKAKGVVVKEGADFGRGIEQGSVYRLPLPTRLVGNTSLTRNTSLTDSTSNKRKDLKDNTKRGSELTLETKNCPDCQGTGFYYPNGIEHGVAKCKHEKLSLSK